jgi:hypothetical protein
MKMLIAFRQRRESAESLLSDFRVETAFRELALSESRFCRLFLVTFLGCADWFTTFSTTKKKPLPLMVRGILAPRQANFAAEFRADLWILLPNVSPGRRG